MTQKLMNIFIAAVMGLQLTACSDNKDNKAEEYKYISIPGMIENCPSQRNPDIQRKCERTVLERQSELSQLIYNDASTTQLQKESCSTSGLEGTMIEQIDSYTPKCVQSFDAKSDAKSINVWILKVLESAAHNRKGPQP